MDQHFKLTQLLRERVPCEDLFDELAKNDDELLAYALTSGQLGEADMLFAALALGEWGRSEIAIPTLVSLSDHPSMFAREGAIEGLACHVEDDRAREALIVRTTEREHMPELRTAARAILEYA